MDRIEEQLKEDARAIDATVPPALAARIDASIDTVAPRYPRGARPRSAFTWWLLSSLTGAAAVLLVFLLLDGGGSQTPAQRPPAVVSKPAPEAVSPPVEIPLDVRTAEFTEPLAEELENLKSDFEKAREKLGEDLRLTL